MFRDNGVFVGDRLKNFQLVDYPSAALFFCSLMRAPVDVSPNFLRHLVWGGPYWTQKTTVVKCEFATGTTIPWPRYAANGIIKLQLQ